MMKLRVVIPVCLILGAVAGAATSFLLVRHATNNFFESQYEMKCLDILNVLQQIKSGNAETLEKDLEARIPEWAVGVPKLVSDPQRINRILWEVQRFYEENVVPVPEQLRPLLQPLPPRPPTVCSIKQDAGKKTE